jgi:hypothetical protein
MLRCSLPLRVTLPLQQRCRMAAASARVRNLAAALKLSAIAARRCYLHTSGRFSQEAILPAAAPLSVQTAAPSMAAPVSSVPRGGGCWLMLADMHFDARRLPRLLATCAWFVTEVKKQQPSHIFLLGDTLHTRNEVHVEASSAVANFIRMLLQVRYPNGKPQPHIHVLIGNQSVRASASETSSTILLLTHLL